MSLRPLCEDLQGTRGNIYLLYCFSVFVLCVGYRILPSVEDFCQVKDKNQRGIGDSSYA